MEMPTGRVRWYRRRYTAEERQAWGQAHGAYSAPPFHDLVLQQAWSDQFGNIEWKDVPTEDQKESANPTVGSVEPFEDGRW